jgi:hypothetical protein
MSIVKVGGGKQNLFKVRKGLAIVESDDNFLNESFFYKVPANQLGDVYVELKVRNMSGRIIAFNANADYSGSNILKIGKSIHEADLVQNGFEILTTQVTKHGLKLITATRPEPIFNAFEADKLLKIIKDPASFYDYAINTTNTSVATLDDLDDNQIKELFQEVGYKINDEIIELIRTQDFTDIEPSDGKNENSKLSLQHTEIMNVFAKIPSNLLAVSKHGCFIKNAKLIIDYDEFHKKNQLNDTDESDHKLNYTEKNSPS